MEWKFPYYNVTNGMDWSVLSTYKWVKDMNETPQDSIWHGEGNVFIHTMMVINALQELEEFKQLSEQDKHILSVSALFHDVEKPSTTKEELYDGRLCVVAPRHAQKGEKTTREILYKEFNVPFHIREEICSLVRYHGVPLWNTSKDNYFETKLLNISMRCRLNLLKILSEADIRGRICPDKAELIEKVEYFKLECEDLDLYHQSKTFKTKMFRNYALNSDVYVSDEWNIYDETDFTVHMLSGIPGSGKDHYIKNNLEDLPMVSLDGVRREMNIDPTDKKGNGRVYQHSKELCKVHMRNNKDFVFNATNITREMRSRWLQLFQSYGGKVIIHYIEKPYKKVLNQNSNRNYKVPEKVIDKLIRKLEPPQYKECFDVVYNV